MVDPLHQFEIHTLIPLRLLGYDISFTNASLAMVLTTLIVIGGLTLALKARYQNPTRLYVVVESLFHFVGDVLKTYVGRAGWAYFPYVFALFMFILVGNLVGLVPYTFTFTSHIIVTFGMAALVFIGATAVGIARHGVGFLRLFFPEGIPLFVAPLLVPVEIISYLSRPISLGVRLFANMVAGHVMLKIFAGFAALIAASSFGVLAVVPVAMNVLINVFEVLVAVLQAYVFTILTCIYLNDAINLH